MAVATNVMHPDLETLAGMIARSPIIVVRAAALRRLPARYEAVDVAILDWIAAEARRASRGRSLVAM
jgi:hypothetical protein